MSFQGGPGFCAQACTPHHFGQTCDLAAGANGTPECFWNLGNGGWGCSIRCASTPCPRGFRAAETPGFWAGCACVR